MSLNVDRQNTLPTRYGCLDGPPVIDGDDQQTRDATYVVNMADTNRTLLESDAADTNVMNVENSNNTGTELWWLSFAEAGRTIATADPNRDYEYDNIIARTNRETELEWLTSHPS